MWKGVGWLYVGLPPHIRGQKMGDFCIFWKDLKHTFQKRPFSEKRQIFSPTVLTFFS